MKRTPVQFALSYERALAIILDLIILSLPEAVILSVGGAGTLAATLGQYALYAAYFTYFESSSWQATPGKRIMKIFVVNADGTPLIKRDALARFIAFSMFTFPAHVSFLDREEASMLMVWLVLVWFIPMVSTREKTAMQDILCRTRVLRGLRAKKLEFK